MYITTDHTSTADNKWAMTQIQPPADQNYVWISDSSGATNTITIPSASEGLNADALNSFYGSQRWDTQASGDWRAFYNNNASIDMQYYDGNKWVGVTNY